jgi:putative transposase
MEHRKMSLKIDFVERARRPGANVSALCREFGITRQTGHKWIRRFRQEGYGGLEERSRRPQSAPLSTAEEIVAAVVQERVAHPNWGPAKIRLLVRRAHGDATPSSSTIVRILRRFGQVRQRRTKRRLSVIERAPDVSARSPNEIWTVDFKGWWRVREGHRCEPLTVRDAYSRYVLAVKVLGGTSMPPVRKVLNSLFQKHGLPQVIQCDNGTPFINTAARAGLTQLSAWWVSLGIKVLRSRPRCPQDNGGHERMHRDLKADVQVFPSISLRAEQRACDRWRQEFNHVRPHDALGGKVPADLYRPSCRRASANVPFAYPRGFVVRTACPAGVISVSGEKYAISRSVGGHRLGLEHLKDLRYRIWLHGLDLGEIELLPTDVVDDISTQVLAAPFKKYVQKAA